MKYTMVCKYLVYILIKCTQPNEKSKKATLAGRKRTNAISTSNLIRRPSIKTSRRVVNHPSGETRIGESNLKTQRLLSCQNQFQCFVGSNLRALSKAKCAKVLQFTSSIAVNAQRCIFIFIVRQSEVAEKIFYYKVYNKNLLDPQCVNIMVCVFKCYRFSC